MKRRDFLTAAASTVAGSRLLVPGGALTMGVLGSPMAHAYSLSQRLVIQLTLDGGPDLRYMVVPMPEQADGFAKSYWENNFRSHNLRSGSYDDARKRWDEDYLPVTLDGRTFGVLKRAQWLADLLGRTSGSGVGAALVSNVVGSTSRNHVRSLMALDYGRHDTLASEYNHSGWGGRLASVLGGRVVSLTRTPREFCFSPRFPGSNLRAHYDDLLNLTTARNAGLYDQRRASGGKERQWNASASRALQGYYGGLQQRTTSSRMSSLLEHEAQLRELGRMMEQRLDSVTRPQAIDQLSTSGSSRRLQNQDFARQVQTAYDLINHSTDLLNTRVLSMDYGGWDTHNNQKSRMDPRLEDLFGRNKGLHTLFSSLSSQSRANTVIIINGEFGRQTRSNLDKGTDHGRGNSMLVLGQSVRTGVYGELFPEAEVDRMRTERTPDIEGRTHIEHLQKAVADWAYGGNTGQFVMNQPTSQLILEENAGLNRLF